MSLLSIEFFLFFFLFYFLYLQGKFQTQLLTLASFGLLFYASPFFASVIFGYSLNIYLISRSITFSKTNTRKNILKFGIFFAIITLAFFKYFDFLKTFFQNIELLNHYDFLMPLGLSYYIFQSIAYLTSVYKNNDNQLTLQETLLHFSFFPTITAGPIFRVEGFKHKFGITPGFLSQIRQPKTILRPALALSLITLGIAKKWWFAGHIAELIVDPVFSNPLSFHSLDILAAIYGYTFQLFFDFSGYSDMAIGIGMLLGFQLPMNFNMPLRAISIQDFWNRWHMSLSCWIRDYIYIPLGGNKVRFLTKQRNLLIAFLLSGLWHGATFNFVLWGFLHGIALIIQNTIKLLMPESSSRFNTLKKGFSILITFHFVTFSFLVFKTQDFTELKNILFSLLQNTHQGTLSLYAFLFIILVFEFITLYPLLDKLFNEFINVLEKTPMIFWSVIFSLLLIVICYFAPSGVPGFIYANF